MSMNNLSIDGEFRYIIQWFNEWSELQRDDFIPVLLDCLNKDVPSVYMNGVVNAVANAGVTDKPMSLFQCRIKLFREWTPKWSVELRHKLKDKVIELDSKVGEKIIGEIKKHNETHSNKTATDVEVNEEIVAAAEAVVEATENALNEDSRLSLTIDSNEITTDISAATEVVSGLQAELDKQVEIPITTEYVVAQTISNNTEVPLIA